MFTTGTKLNANVIGAQAHRRFTDHRDLPGALWGGVSARVPLDARHPPPCCVRSCSPPHGGSDAETHPPQTAITPTRFLRKRAAAEGGSMDGPGSAQVRKSQLSPPYHVIFSQQLTCILWCRYGEFSAAADVWSFGVLCYEAFNRAQLPFTGYSNVEAYDKINAGIPVPLDSIRRLAPTVVTRCFNFEPDRRPTAAALEGALTSSKAQGCEGSDDNTDGVVALARQHRDSVDIDDGHRPGESFISVSDGTGLNLPPAAQDSETTDMGPDDVFGEDSDYAGENEDCAFGVTRERPAVRLMRPVPIRPDQLVPFAMRVSDAIDKAGDPVPFESTSLFPLSRATTQPVRLSRGEHDSFRSRSMYWKFGTVVEPADVPAELWTLGTLTETVTLAILYQANLLLKAAQSSSREGRLTAITQWAFSILSFGLPQCVPLRTGSRFGCVAGADCNFHAFCEPVKDDSGSVAFGLTSSDISFGVSGTCSKIIQWDDGVLYVRNGLVIEVTLGESAGYNRYSVELPDAAFLGLDGGQVSRSLAGTGQVASTDSATKLEISFNADGDDQGDSMAVTGTAVFDEKNSVATIEGRTHTSATLSFHASPGQPIRLNAKEARMPLFVSVRPTTNPQEEQWNALTSKLPTNPNEFATDFVTKARALWSKASDSSRGRDEPFVFSVSRDGRVSAGLTGHQLPSALRRSSVCRNDLYPFEDSETRVRAARVQIRRDLICTRRSSSGSVRRASSRANAQCDRTSTPRVVIESV